MAQPRNPPPRERGDSTLLAGRYRYEGELGRGASGRVLALTDRGGAARVAKLLDAHAGARAQWELDALLAVESPHLVRAVELLRAVDALPAPFSIPRGGWVLVETRAPGERSDRVLAELTDLERRAERIADAARGVARGLAALHAHGLSHGDVKPENVLLEGTHATLIDLGAAAPFGRLESVSGTLAFLAPEAREGERSVATDLYALGATLLAWATGIEPHPEQPLPSWLPTPLASLVRALLDERVADRPRDAAAVLTALGEPPRAAGALASFAPPRPVGIGDAIDKLVRLLDEHGWAVIVGPDGSGRARLAEEGARALQRREARAGHEVPTLVRTSDAPVAPEASSVIVLEGTP
ncbi:MAG: phosphotransferase, partial [Sandaracinaceae bacterium]|nr:phosphotransferase [Sandaracinaceae bacterium]